MSPSHDLIVTLLLAALCFSLLKFWRPFCWAVDSIHDKEFQQGKMR